MPEVDFPSGISPSEILLGTADGGGGAPEGGGKWLRGSGFEGVGYLSFRVGVGIEHEHGISGRGGVGESQGEEAGM